ncbi:MAG TPA: hypothetical protein PKD55_11395 [Bellilinea sp.]|nr:hypothetical protein [Bellilinea sp.]
MNAKMFWDLETGFWRGDRAYYEKELATKSLMVFPQPVGVLDREQTLESVGDSARWDTVRFSEKHYLAPSDDCRVLVYRVHARREEMPPYEALCSSVYARVKFEFVLVSHQQTPIDCSFRSQKRK